MICCGTVLRNDMSEERGDVVGKAREAFQNVSRVLLSTSVNFACYLLPPITFCRHLLKSL